MRGLARVLRRLADHIDPPKPQAFTINVHGHELTAARGGREIAQTLERYQRATGRPAPPPRYPTLPDPTIRQRT